MGKEKVLVPGKPNSVVSMLTITIVFVAAAAIVTVLVAPRTLAFLPSSASASSSSLNMGLLDSLFGGKTFAEPCVMGDESIMSPKAHGMYLR